MEKGFTSGETVGKTGCGGEVIDEATAVDGVSKNLISLGYVV